MDIKATVGVGTTVLGLAALAFAKLGEQQAAAALQNCMDHANSLSLEALSSCKEAAQESASAAKNIFGGVLVAVGNLFSLFGRVKR